MCELPKNLSNHAKNHKIREDFDRKKICSILGSKEISIRSLDIDEMFFSKAGNYIGEGIDQILTYEMVAINEHDYCLWTFASNAVSIETIRPYCVKRQEDNKDTYVLFAYTPSPKYAVSKSTGHYCLKKEFAQKLSKAELEFLNFDEKNGNYYVPGDIDCTAANDKSANAFVIQELFLIKECVNEKLYDNYKAVNSKGKLYDMKAGGYQRSTYYLQKVNDSGDMFELPKHRSFCFMGKLAAPYIIKLERSDNENMYQADRETKTER